MNFAILRTVLVSGLNQQGDSNRQLFKCVGFMQSISVPLKSLDEEILAFNSAIMVRERPEKVLNLGKSRI